MPILATYRDLETLSQERLDRLCRLLSLEWESKGCPGVEDMPTSMLFEYVRLKRERERRGEQLRLC